MTPHERRIYKLVNLEFQKLFDYLERENARLYGPEDDAKDGNEKKKFILREDVYLDMRARCNL